MSPWKSSWVDEVWLLIDTDALLIRRLFNLIGKRSQLPRGYNACDPIAALLVHVFIYLLNVKLRVV
jgi:hypothetical protein